MPQTALPFLISFLVLWKLMSLKRQRKGRRIAGGLEGLSEGREVRSRAWPRMGLLKERSKKPRILRRQKV